ncbi:MAG: methyltransferase family protein [Terriglobia bacterium]
MISDSVALVVLLVQLPIPLFWLVVHPAVGFWRRHPRACYYGVGTSIWVLTGVALLGLREWWLGERFSGPETSGLVALAGAGLIVVDLWLMRQVKRDLHWRALLGLPELLRRQRPGRVATAGIYARVRHPRYLGMMSAWLGAALLSGATRLLVLVAVFMGLALLVTELEERELLARLGEAYGDYRRRVPRLLPRLR